MVKLEEYDFFDEMCFVALDISKEVKFAAVIDAKGKLIAGKQCNDGYINNDIARARLQLSSVATENRQDSDSVSASTTFCLYNTNYLFYANYLTNILKRIKGHVWHLDNNNTEQRSEHRIELVKIHGLLKIAIAPLTANNDRYLCMYLESKSSDQEIIAKISNAI